MKLSGIDPLERNKTFAADIYGRLRFAIMSGALKPGERVSTRSVAESAAVSFTPAREAIARLIAEGALEQAGPKTVLVPELRRHDYQEITALRLQLEGMAVETAAQNISAGDLRELSDIQRDYEKVRNENHFAEALMLNERFHFTIYRASNMPRLIAIIEGLWIQVGPTFNLLLPTIPTHRTPHSFHHAAMEALAARDGTAAREAIQQDIRYGSERLLPALKD